MTKFEQFRNALVEAGFEDTNSLTYHLFDGDETPEHETYDWRDREKLNDIFDKVCNEHGYVHKECEGGGEGEGEYCYGVIELDGTFYKAEWSYYSYNGCDYNYINDTIKEVVPVQKVITVYE